MTQPRAAAPQGSSFANAVTLFRVRGVPIRVDVSWLIIAGLVVWLFFTRFNALLAEHGQTTVLVAAVVATLLFFASLLAHELGHAVTSLDRDIPVLGVTLFLLGGVTESTKESTRARDEFVIVGIGPFISLVLAAAFGLVHAGVAAQPVLGAIAGYLAWVNLLLAVFNLVPGYPLDGGRLLRSLLWGATGQPHKATRWAARVGQAFALALIALGIWAFLRTTGTFGGLWEVLIGVFLYRGAAQSHKQAVTRERLAGRRVREVMGTVPPPLPVDLRLDEAVDRVAERPSLLWPIGPPLVGALTLASIDAVPEARWHTTRVRDVAYPAERISVEADASMDTAFDRIIDAPGQMLIVVEHGRPVGLLTPSLVTGEVGA